ncbi:MULTISPECIES: hypothetical protein [Dyadobacter]|uniref:hypothetical protein n=1 Tax=Dyadobacter TaxID=120831 RepID=UPI001375584F|nr:MULTISPECIES: hypothetical protein [Dyadobacter]GGC15508.1 hypothetical protein GCM10011325_47930 [Dyadobacter sediminis]
MKNLLPFFLIIVLGCKDELDLDPYNGDIGSIVKEINIDGVRDENIKRFNNQIFVKLPVDYPYGNLIRPKIQLNNQFHVATDLSQGLPFEAQSVEIVVESDTYGASNFYIHVSPSVPLEFTGNPKNIEVKIEPNAYAEIYMNNLGTYPFSNDSGMLFQDIPVNLRNTISGQITRTSGLILPDTNGVKRLAIAIPLNSTVGNYTPIVQVGERQAEFPSILKITYGKLGLFPSDWKASVANASLVVTGYNILPNNNYELEIFNDFMPARSIQLKRIDDNSLSAAVPTDLPFGDYSAKILVNSKEYEITEILNPRHFNLHFLASSSQPYIQSLSQSNLLNNNACSYYKETKIIARDQDILANIQLEPNAEDIKLKLINRKTKEEHLLTSLPGRIHASCFNQFYLRFSITKEVTDGTYEVYVIVTNHDTTMQTSEAFGEIVSIQ